MGRGLVATVSLLAALLVAPGVASAQEDLAGLQAQLDAAQSEVDSAEGALADAQQRLAAAERQAAPEEKAAERAERRAEAAESRVDALAEELAVQREEAADEVEEANQEYADDKDQRDSERSSGAIVLGLGIVGVIAVLLLRRFRGWRPSGWRRIALYGGLGLLVVVGIGMVVFPHQADEPEFSEGTLALAEAADDDVLASPTPELEAALEEAEPLRAEADELAAAAEKAHAPAIQVEDEIDELQSRLAAATEKTNDLADQVQDAEREAAEEAAFRAEATTIDYDQLIKSPEEYRGTKVVYTGKIFQIQEQLGRSIILLSVTDEGYGFWTDEIWVDAGEIASAEEDMITVYGEVTGTKTYQTQIGGSRFVPRVRAKYIDE